MPENADNEIENFFGKIELRCYKYKYFCKEISFAIW